MANTNNRAKPKIINPNKQLIALIGQAKKIAREYLIKIVKNYLSDIRSADLFIMTSGSWCFYTSWSEEMEDSHFPLVVQFMHDWDLPLEITQEELTISFKDI